jgi:hypothetical protein
MSRLFTDKKRNKMDKIKLAQRTIALLSSMIESGECHTARTKEMKTNALSGLDEVNNLLISGVVVNEAEKEFKPCGEGDNVCKCEDASECGYSSEVALCGKPNCNRQKLDNSPLCSYHWDIANS